MILNYLRTKEKLWRCWQLLIEWISRDLVFVFTRFPFLSFFSRVILIFAVLLYPRVENQIYEFYTVIEGITVDVDLCWRAVDQSCFPAEGLGVLVGFVDLVGLWVLVGHGLLVGLGVLVGLVVLAEVGCLARRNNDEEVLLGGLLSSALAARRKVRASKSKGTFGRHCPLGGGEAKQKASKGKNWEDMIALVCWGRREACMAISNIILNTTYRGKWNCFFLAIFIPIKNS